MAYSDKVVDHFNNPRNVGSLPKQDPSVGTGLVGAPERGDVMKLQVRVNPETGVIDEAKFKTFGCGSAIASSSLATEWLKGKTVDEALAIKNTDIVAELAHSSIRFGLGRFNTEEEVDYVVAKLVSVVSKLREMSPLYEMVKDGVDLTKVEWSAH